MNGCEPDSDNVGVLVEHRDRVDRSAQLPPVQPAGAVVSPNADLGAATRLERASQQAGRQAREDEHDGEAGETRVNFARCADGNGTLSHLFFSNDAFDLARAKAICSRCGLAERCRSVALARAEPYGVWGGALIIDGVEVTTKRGRGRPPKHPRPPVVVDEVPLPPGLIAS